MLLEHMCLFNFVEVLSRYNRGNYKMETSERQKTLQCISLVFGETMRFGDFQVDVKSMLRHKFNIQISKQMNVKFHCWGKIGRYGILHVLGQPNALSFVEYLIHDGKDVTKEKSEIWDFVGRRRCLENEDKCLLGTGVGPGLLVLLFDKDYTIEYMMYKVIMSKIWQLLFLLKSISQLCDPDIEGAL